MRFGIFEILIIASIIRLIIKKVSETNGQGDKSRNQSKSVDRGATNPSQRNYKKQVEKKVEQGYGSIFDAFKRLQDEFDPQRVEQKKKQAKNKAKQAKKQSPFIEKKEEEDFYRGGETLEGYSMHMRGYDEHDFEHKREAARQYHSERTAIADEMLVQKIQEKPETKVAFKVFGGIDNNARQSELRKAIVYSEIFGKPKSMRR